MQWLYTQWRWFYLGLVEMRAHWEYFRRKRIKVRRRDAHQWLMATCAVGALGIHAGSQNVKCCWKKVQGQS